MLFTQCILLHAAHWTIASPQAMNGAGVIILTLWNYDEMGVQSSFGTPPSPALRLGDALVAMCVALGIAGIFQMFSASLAPCPALIYG